MDLKSLIFFVVALGVNGDEIQSPTVTPAELVQAADNVRFPKDSFSVMVNVINYENNQKSTERVYQILSKGNTDTIVKTLSPASDAGQIMLMKDSDLWIFLKDVDQPVRMPASQRLTGQVANGDLARANFTGDYTPLFIRNESQYAVLELTAVNRKVTYHKVLYWIDIYTSRPHKAEFYTVSGKLLKTCFYLNFKPMNNSIRPTRLIMKDELNKDQYSEMLYSDMKSVELPDKVFTKEYLKKLK